jgi:hypothetical protein
MGAGDDPESPGFPPRLRRTASVPGLSWRGIEFYPTADPAEYARRKAAAIAAAPRSLVYVPSVGLGHGLAELLAVLPADCAVLCVEVFPAIMATAMEAGLLPRDPRLLVVRTDGPAGAAEALERLDPRRFRRVVRAALCAGYRLAPAAYDAIHAALEEGLKRSWQNRITLMAMGSLQVRNAADNLGSLPGALDFGALGAEAPVVVAGAGPSLDDVLTSLARVRDRYVLVAVDTALPSLRAAGFSPDVVVALEAQAVNLQDFVGHTGDPHTLLACDLSSHPDGPRLFPGRTAFFSSRFAPLALFDRLSAAGILPFPFPALGSVGVAAAHAGLLLGRGDVYLAGLDFSYGNGLTHARGSPVHGAMLVRCARRNPPGSDLYAALAARPRLHAEGKSGHAVITDSLLRSYRDTLAARIAPEAGRVADVGARGLPLGALLLPVTEMEQRLAGSAAVRGVAVDAARRFAPDAVRAFVGEELRLLADARDSLRDAAAARPADAAAEALVRSVDYTWAHFPEFPDVPGLTAAFVARVRVAVAWYEKRLRRVDAALQAAGP